MLARAFIFGALTAGLAVCGAFFSGCASTYEVKVDAITKPVPASAQSYRIKSKNPALGEESLRYREAEQFVKTALAGKGYYEAPSDDQADMIVVLDFGMETPRMKAETVRVPVYADATNSLNNITPTEPRLTAGRRRDDPVTTRTEVIDYRDVIQPVTVYEKYLRLTARENRPAAEGKPPAELWSVQVTAEDESRDLRRYLPVLASATADYIGRDSHHEQVVKIRADSPGVELIRQAPAELVTPAAAATTASTTPRDSGS